MMRSSYKCAITAGLGAAAGFFAGWKVHEAYINKLVDNYQEEDYDYPTDEEMSDLKEKLDQIIEEDEQKTVKDAVVQQAVTKPDISEYTNRLEKYKQGFKQEKGVLENRPYIIDADDFNERDDYDVMYVTMFTDGIICDDLNNPLENVDIDLGNDNINRFANDWDDDAMFIRNEYLKCDYELLKDNRTFNEVLEATVE